MCAGGSEDGAGKLSGRSDHQWLVRAKPELGAQEAMRLRVDCWLESPKFTGPGLARQACQTAATMDSRGLAASASLGGHVVEARANHDHRVPAGP